MDRAEVIEILEGEVREAKGIARIQAIKLLLGEMEHDPAEALRPVPSSVVKLSERRAKRAG